MNEHRLVTLILIVLLVLGAAGIVAVYLITYGRMKTLPGPASPVRTKPDLPDKTAKQPSSPPVPVFRGAVSVPADLPSKSPTITIHETSNSNGSFNTAQEITEGIVIGKRGAAGDRSDFYKIRATKKTMILRLEPVLKKESQRFAISVFDANKKPVGKDSRKTGPTKSLEVKPGATYYIKLDLRHAPVKKPQYKLNVKFE